MVKRAARPSVLFTAFTAEGDRLAAPVISQLREGVPELVVFGLGGSAMAEAGAQMVEQTLADGGPERRAASASPRRHVAALRRWTSEHRVGVHIAAGPCAGNDAAARMFRKIGARVVRLGAPPLWRRGRGGVKSLGRGSDLVICHLPFEEAWFSRRGVTARFVGHPAMNRLIDQNELREQMHGLPQGAPRLLLYPGHTTAEVSAHVRMLAEIFAELQGRNAGAGGVIVAENATINRVVRRKISVFPTGMHMVTGMTDAAIGWADLAVIVAGPIALDLTRLRKPMIAFRKANPLTWLWETVTMHNRLRLLPNIIAEREVVPEYVPHLGGPTAIIKQATRYMQDSKHAAVQSEGLARVCMRFANKKPAEESARLILKILRDGRVD